MIISVFNKEIAGLGGIKVAEIGMVVDTNVRAEGVLRTIEIEVTVGAVWMGGSVTHKVATETVAHPNA